MKNCNGYSLIEVMIALLILASAICVFLPAIIKVQEERHAIRMERFVETRMNAYFEKVVIAKEHVYETFQYDSISFLAYTEETGEQLIFCITWTGRNERKYERCLSTYEEK